MSSNEEKLFDYQEFGCVEKKEISAEADIISKTSVLAMKMLDPDGNQNAF